MGTESLSAAPLIIGLTGSIGTGKSMVASMFRELGGRTIDADQVARDVVLPDRPAYREIVAEFGEQVVRPDCALDRDAIRCAVFADAAKRRRLEEIVHPRVIEEIATAIGHFIEAGSEPIIIEAALLIETASALPLDAVVVVTCDEQVQIERIRARDGLSEEDARAIIKAQLPSSEKVKYADYVIENNRAPADARAQVVSVWNMIKSRRR